MVLPRPFVMWPDKRLRTRADDVDAVDDTIRAIWDEMVEAMDAMPGVGLAAPQLGVMLRLAVVDGSEERGRAVRLANPVLIEASDKLQTHTEASPNLPGAAARITRPARVVVRYLGEDGGETERAFEGIEAASVQHQIDHLEGRMYFDNLSKVKRDMLLRRARKTGKG